MIKYGAEQWNELRFQSFRPHIESHDGAWIDIELELELSPFTPVPDDVTDLTAFIICALDGAIVEIVPRDEGRDCEYQFTVEEKAQLTAYIALPAVQEQIVQAVSK